MSQTKESSTSRNCRRFTQSRRQSILAPTCMLRPSVRIATNNRSGRSEPLVEDLQRLADWFVRCGIRTIVMTSTGVYFLSPGS
jgi:hypothetical protein